MISTTTNRKNKAPHCVGFALDSVWQVSAALATAETLRTLAPQQEEPGAVC